VTLPPSGSSEELDSVAFAAEAIYPLGIGLPAAWWPTVGGAASLIFAAFWMMESWEKNYLTQDLAGLLVVFVCSYAIYRFWKPRSETLGIVLALAAAAAAMTLHRM
jgi:hypothetical protein